MKPVLYFIALSVSVIACAQRPRQSSFLENMAVAVERSGQADRWADTGHRLGRFRDQPPLDDLGLSASESAQVQSQVLGATSEPILWMARPKGGDALYVYTGHYNEGGGGPGEVFQLTRSKDGNWALVSDDAMGQWAGYP